MLVAFWLGIVDLYTFFFDFRTGLGITEIAKRCATAICFTTDNRITIGAHQPRIADVDEFAWRPVDTFPVTGIEDTAESLILRHTNLILVAVVD